MSDITVVCTCGVEWKITDKKPPKCFGQEGHQHSVNGIPITVCGRPAK